MYTYIFRLSFFLFFPVELFLVGFPFGDLWWWGIAPLGGGKKGEEGRGLASVGSRRVGWRGLGIDILVFRKFLVTMATAGFIGSLARYYWKGKIGS